MQEQDIIDQLLGPVGGTFALGMIVGSFLTWVGNLKLINPWVQKAHEAEITAMQSKIEALEQNFKSQMGAMESRIRELEVTEAEYFKVLKQRANLDVNAQSKPTQS